MNYEKIINEQLNNYVSDSDMNSLSDKINGLSSGLAENYSLDKIVESIINGKSIFQSEDLISSLKDLFLYEIKVTLIFAIEIVAVCIAFSIITSLSNKSSQTRMSELGRFVCVLILSGFILQNFSQIYNYTVDAVGGLTDVMSILLPIILTILVASGNITSGTVLSPLMITLIDVFANILQYLVFPLIFLTIILKIADCLSEKKYVNNLSDLSEKGAVFLCGLLATVMTGVVSVQGLISKCSDSLIMDSAKYSIGNFIPIVGGFTSDTLELFLKCMSTIKTAFGAFAIISIILIILIPIIKIFVVAVIYKLVSVIIEPICDEKVSATISKISSTYFIMDAVVFFCGLLFIIFITIIIRLGV